MRDKMKKNENTTDTSNSVVEWIGPNKLNKKNENTENKETDDTLEEENNIKDYLETHKMLLEMDKINKEEKSKGESDDSLEDVNKLKQEYLNVNIDEVIKTENYIEENFNLKNISKEQSSEEEETMDYSKLECIKISLENELGDNLFASLYRIIEDNVK